MQYCIWETIHIVVYPPLFQLSGLPAGSTVSLNTTTSQVDACALYERRFGFRLADSVPFAGPLPLMHHQHGIRDLTYELKV